MLAIYAGAFLNVRSLRAQPQPAQYEVVIVTPEPAGASGLQDALNAASKGRELVSVIPSDKPRQYLAVYRK
jgi:hypothetical protein